MWNFKSFFFETDNDDNTKKIFFVLLGEVTLQVGLDETIDSFVDLVPSREILHGVMPALECGAASVDLTEETKNFELVSFGVVDEVSGGGSVASFGNKEDRGRVFNELVGGSVVLGDGPASGAGHVNDVALELGSEEGVDLILGKGAGLLAQKGDEERAEDVGGDGALSDDTVEARLNDLSANDGVLGHELVTLLAGDGADVFSDSEVLCNTEDGLAVVTDDLEGGDGSEGEDVEEGGGAGAVGTGHGDLEFVFDAEEGEEPDDGARGLCDGVSEEDEFVGHFLF